MQQRIRTGIHDPELAPVGAHVWTAQSARRDQPDGLGRARVGVGQQNVAGVEGPHRRFIAVERGRELIDDHGQVLIGAAAAAIVLIGLGVAAHESGPGSPLWPLTRLAYPQHAEVVAAESAIDDARSAVDAGRYDDARRLLAVASSHVARVDNQATARRLRTEIADIQRELDTIAPVTPAPAAPAPPSGAGNPASPTPTPPPVGTAPGGGQPQPGQTAGEAPATTRPPILQTPPLPSLPVPPPPSLPLPTSILPSLPLRL